MWPWTWKSRLFILSEVNDEGNKVKAEDNIDIFTYENFHVYFAANVDGLFITILSVI
jgi:hypothetical protein